MAEPEKIESAAVTQVGSNQTAASPVETQRLERTPASGSLSVDETLSGTLQAMSDSGVRGDAPMRLLIAFTRKTERQLDQCASALERTNNDRDALSTKLKAVEIENAILKERLHSTRKARLSANIMITAGGLVMTVGQQLYSNNQKMEGSMATVVGLALTLVGWYMSQSESSKEGGQ